MTAFRHCNEVMLARTDDTQGQGQGQSQGQGQEQQRKILFDLLKLGDVMPCRH